MVGERLSYYIEKQGFKKKEFCEQFGFTYANFVSVLADKMPLGINLLRKVKIVFPNINTEWLLFGNGDVEIKNENSTLILNESPLIYKKVNSSDNMQQVNNLLIGTIQDKNKIIKSLELELSNIKENKIDLIVLKNSIKSLEEFKELILLKFKIDMEIEKTEIAIKNEDLLKSIQRDQSQIKK